MKEDEIVSQNIMMINKNDPCLFLPLICGWFVLAPNSHGLPVFREICTGYQFGKEYSLLYPSLKVSWLVVGQLRIMWLSGWTSYSRKPWIVDFWKPFFYWLRWRHPWIVGGTIHGWWAQVPARIKWPIARIKWHRARYALWWVTSSWSSNLTNTPTTCAAPKILRFCKPLGIHVHVKEN